MNETIKSILVILEDSTPELQIAAAQIIGELRPREAAVTDALAGRLHSGEDYLSRHIFVALAGIRTPAAVDVLVRSLEDHGPHGDLVAHLLGDLGKDAAAPLAAAFDSIGIEGQVRVLAVLGRVPGARSVSVMEKALLIPELSRRAGDAMLQFHVDELEPRSRKALKDRLCKVLTHEADLPPQCVATILQVLGRADGMGSRAMLLKFADVAHPAMVRKAALTALRGVRLTPTLANALLDHLGEDDVQNVVQPTIRLLEEVDSWNPAALQSLKKLVSSRRDHLRLFGLRAMKHVRSADVVKPLTNHLLGDLPDLRDAAVAALSHNPHALEPLLRSFLIEKRPSRSRLLALPLRELGKSLTPAQVKTVAERGCRLLFAHEPHGEQILDLLVRVKPEQATALLVDKATRMRRARKLLESLAILVFLAQFERLDHEGRYQLALSRLLRDGTNGRPENEVAGDATMGYFASLVREGFPVFDRLKRESMVTPEALLRVGAHFSEGVGSERRFGSEVLHHLAQKHARRRAGEEARMVLRTEGL